MTKTHVLLISGFFGATATVIGGLDHWHDLGHPAIIAGFLAQLSTMLMAIYSDKPGSN